MPKEILDEVIGGKITIRKKGLVLVENIVLLANLVAVLPIAYILLEYIWNGELLVALFILCIAVAMLAHPPFYIYKWRKATQAFDESQQVDILQQEVLKANIFLDFVFALIGNGGFVTLIGVYLAVQPETGLFIGFSLMALFLTLGPIQLLFFIYIHRLRNQIIHIKTV